MSTAELIDALCEVTTILADTVRKQQSVINQHGIQMDDGALEEQISREDELLDRIEMEMRTKL